MTGLVRKWRFFAPWREAEHEQWLQEQGRHGLHLESLNSLGFHRFRTGAPADQVYRWAIYPERDAAHYEQLYTDAGWQQAAWVHGYRLWRKPAAAGSTEIFTENRSKVRQHWTEIGVLLPMFIGIGLIIQNANLNEWDDRLWMILFGAIGAFTAYTIARLLQRIAQLKRSN